jgi:hypothetical protein
MTDQIDLDELDSETESEEEAPNRGDWFWKGEGDLADEEVSTGESSSETSADTASAVDTASADDSTAADGNAAADDSTDAETERRRTPHVPHSNKGKPAGIPVEQGGSGSGAVGDESRSGGGKSDGGGESGETAAAEGDEASGPHGGGADDMTMAVSYEAATRLADPEVVFAEASGWADWVGIVGNVNAPVINKFQRDNTIDLDFFNGTGTGPEERLAEVDEFSMFFADRMVLVGVDGEERIAETADWEFIPLGEAAEAADWEVETS